MNFLRTKYDNIDSKYDTKPKRFNNNLFNYLKLSIHHCRDERNFDMKNFLLIKELCADKGLKKNSKVYMYLNSQKEYKYLFDVKILYTLILDLIKFLLQFVDISLIFTLICSIRILEKLRILNSKNNKLSKNNIYSIYYCKNKLDHSANYYYPNSNYEKNKFFISSFSNSRFFSLGILSSILNTKYISPANVLSIRYLLISSLQFLQLFIYDLYLGLFDRNFYFLRFWYGWTKSKEIFYALLVFNSIFLLSMKSEDCEFISWYENQISNKAFSLGVFYSNAKFGYKNSLSTFNGTPFAIQYKKQYLPIKSELQSGFWGSTYYVQDQNSYDEMNYYLNSKKINIKLEIVPESLRRFKKVNYPINLKKKNRLISIFTHDSLLDLISCLNAIFQPKIIKLLSEKLESKKIINIHIRLHPFLNKEKVLKEIRHTNLLPKNVKLKFIDANNETIEESMLLSEYCVFGISSYINLAIKLKCMVLAVETSHINSPPLQIKNKYLKNVQILTPF